MIDGFNEHDNVNSVFQVYVIVCQQPLQRLTLGIAQEALYTHKHIIKTLHLLSLHLLHDVIILY